MTGDEGVKLSEQCMADTSVFLHGEMRLNHIEPTNTYSAMTQYAS